MKTKTNSPSANRRPSPRTRQPAALRQGYGRQAAVRHKSAKAGPRGATVVPDKPVVLFDFDGTLSLGDTNVYFWQYCFRHSIRPWLFLPVVLCGCFVKLLSLVRISGDFEGKYPRIRYIDMLWRQMFRSYLSPALIKKLVPPFVTEHKLRRWGWSAAQVAKELAHRNTVIMISATPDYLIMPLVADMDFDLIVCSEMDSETPWKYRFFCYGINKVHALNALIAAHDIAPRQILRAYSDDKSDRPMMSLAKEPVWINPQTGARKNAA